jgi:cytochrome c oxidase subunit 4
MSGHHPHEIDHHVRVALIVFGALMLLTVATVGAWALLDLSVPMTIALALLIALVKGSLVAGYFMHLLSEKKLIYWVLALTVAFFVVLLLVPMLTSVSDQVTS